MDRKENAEFKEVASDINVLVHWYEDKANHSILCHQVCIDWRVVFQSISSFASEVDCIEF